MHLHDETDRGFTLIATAWIDDSIEALIRSRFIDSKKAADGLLQGDSPIATFSSRIKLLFCMGIISEDVKSDLNIIRTIRNLFAHERGGVNFLTPEVKDRCLSLSLIAELDGITLVDKKQPRTIFNAVVMHLIQYFMRLSERPSRPVSDPHKSIKSYFATLRAGQRRRAKAARAEQEEAEE